MYPFERFNATTKRVLALAQEEAERSHHSYIGTEHILIALMTVPDSVSGFVLSHLGVNLVDVRQIVNTTLGEHKRIVTQQIIPTSRVKTIIELSFSQAREMGDSFVGTEHVLLGLLIEGQGIGAHVLNDLGANLANVRAAIEVVRREGTVVEEIDVRVSEPPRGAVQSAALYSASSGLRLVRFQRDGETDTAANVVYVNPVDVVRLDPLGDDQTSITLRGSGVAPLVVRGAVDEVARRLT